MEHAQDESQGREAAEPAPLLVSLGDAVELTLGEGGTGSESKRYEYN
jgi:hypothetical protein